MNGCKSLCQDFSCTWLTLRSHWFARTSVHCSRVMLSRIWLVLKSDDLVSVLLFLINCVLIFLELILERTSARTCLIAPSCTTVKFWRWLWKRHHLLMHLQFFVNTYLRVWPRTRFLKFICLIIIQRTRWALLMNFLRVLPNTLQLSLYLLLQHQCRSSIQQVRILLHKLSSNISWFITCINL